MSILIWVEGEVAAAALALAARNKERFPIAPGPVPPPPGSAAKFRAVIRRRSTPFRFARGKSAADRGDQATGARTKKLSSQRFARNASKQGGSKRRERISCRHDDTNSVSELLPLGHREFFARKIGESLRSRVREEVWSLRASDQVHSDEVNATRLLFSEGSRRTVSRCGEKRPAY